jgi:hypothetical protein
MTKFHNQPIRIDGVWFQSTKEGLRWRDLQLAERAGTIQDLRRQVAYKLIVNGVLITTYRADFVYQEAGARVVEDAKGVRTPEYRIKAKLMHACLGITILET